MLYLVLLVQSSDTYIVVEWTKNHGIVWAKSSQPFITKKVKAGNFRLS